MFLVINNRRKEHWKHKLDQSNSVNRFHLRSWRSSLASAVRSSARSQWDTKHPGEREYLCLAVCGSETKTTIFIIAKFKAVEHAEINWNNWSPELKHQVGSFGDCMLLSSYHLLWGMCASSSFRLLFLLLQLCSSDWSWGGTATIPGRKARDTSLTCQTHWETLFVFPIIFPHSSGMVVPLLSELKYVNNYWRDCTKILYRHSSRMKHTGFDNGLTFQLAPPWGWVLGFWRKCINKYWTDCHKTLSTHSWPPQDEL